jgi:hypothetical protein
MKHEDLINGILFGIEQAIKEKGVMTNESSFKNALFEYHGFCWCGKEDCRWCGEENAPNFYYKPFDFKVHCVSRVYWYKHIGRSMKINKELTISQIALMFKNCIDSLHLEK